jgi:tetratricopeptide (TPR) repeat protein
MERLLRCANQHRWTVSTPANADTPCPLCGQSSIFDVSPDEQTLDAMPAVPAQDATLGFAPPVAEAENQATVNLDPHALPQASMEPTLDATLDSGPAQAPDAHDQTLNFEAAPNAPYSLSDYQHSRAGTLDSPAPQEGFQQTTEFGAAGQPLAPTGVFQTDGSPATTPQRKRGPSFPTAPIAGYEIISILGHGGMGVVYMARHVQLDRVVALKMVLAGARASRSDRDKFLSEARAVAQLTHPNILQIFEVGEHDGQPYFSLEYLDGGTLQEKLEKYSMPPREAAQFVETIARALHYGHQKGILHRDIKPANVLLSGDGVPKIADFGLALRLDRGQTGPSNIVVGTPVYMSPEQATGQADIGPAADIYSLGATLYEMICGRPPFRGSTIMDTLNLVKTAEPVAPRQLQPSVPPDLQTICLKCLHKNPAQRYATAEAFANDLRNYLDGRPIDARPSSVWEKTWKWSRRNPAAALLIAVSCASLLAFAVGGTAFAISENQRAEEQASLRKIADQQREEAIRQEKHAQAQELIAKDERKKAEEQREEAVRQEKIAQQQRELAIQRGQEALENYQSAQAAIEVLVKVAKNRMTAERHIDTLGKEVLEEALRFYDGFLLKKPNDPAMRVQVARAQMLAGDLREKLGNYEKADETYRLAEKFYQDLLRDDPAKATEYRRDLAGIYINRSTLLQVLNKDQEADDAFAKAKELLDKNAVNLIRDPTTEWMMAAGCNNRGIYLHQRGQFNLADQAYRQGIALFSRLTLDFPKDLSYQVELAKTKTNLAYLWTIPSPGQPAKAEPLYREAIDELTPVLKRQPETPVFQKEFGRAFLNRGILYSNQQRYAEADKDFAQAVATFEEMAANFPGVADYRYLAAAAQINLGSSKQRQKDWEPSIAAYRQADERLKKLVADEPKITSYQHDWAFCAGNLASVLEQQLRDTVKSAKDTASNKEWAGLAEETERSWYMALQRWKHVNQIDAGQLKNAAELVKTFSRINEFHKYHAGVLRKIKPAEAETQLERRVLLCKEMLAKRPTERVLKDLVGESLLALALMRVEMKSHVRAAQTIDEFSKLVPADSPLYPLAAGGLAQCLDVADKTLKAGERDKAMKVYGDSAVAMLAAAVQAGWNNGKFLQSHPILQPLRQRPEYRARLEQLQKDLDRE